MPVLGLSADQGTIPDIAAVIRPFASDIRGETIANCGHFQPEEQLEAVADALLRFSIRVRGNDRYPGRIYRLNRCLSDIRN